MNRTSVSSEAKSIKIDSSDISMQTEIEKVIDSPKIESFDSSTQTDSAEPVQKVIIEKESEESKEAR